MRTLVLLFALVAASAGAVTIENLTDANHLSGPSVKQADVDGKALAVVRWGLGCGPCARAMPAISEFYDKEMKKDARVVFIAVESWNRPKDAVLDYLKENDYAFPVYQRLAIAGEPKAGGVPFAYVLNAKGEVVWQGHPGNRTFFENAVEEAAKTVILSPEAALTNGLAFEHNKDMARRLVPGRNIEGALMQLKSRARRGGAAGEEAAAILARCETWGTETEAAVREALAAMPSKALTLGRLYMRTLPTKAAALKADLAAAAQDPATRALASARQTLDATRAKPATTPNARKQALTRANLMLARLDKLEGASEADLADVRAQWQAYADSLK